MSASEEEVRITSPFDGSVASDERELAVDESVPQSSAFPNLQFVPDSYLVVMRHGGRRVREESVGASRSE